MSRIGGLSRTYKSSKFRLISSGEGGKGKHNDSPNRDTNPTISCNMDRQSSGSLGIYKNKYNVPCVGLGLDLQEQEHAH